MGTACKIVLLCSTCYNARMVDAKQTRKQKRRAKSAGTDKPPAAAKKVKMSAGLSKGKASTSVKSKQAANVLPQAQMCFTPKRQASCRDPLERAEERMLQDALKASLEEKFETLSPLKTLKEGEPALLVTYNTILKAQGRSEITALDVERLPAAVHSDGYGVLDQSEVVNMKHTKDAYLRFMHSKEASSTNSSFVGSEEFGVVGLVRAGRKHKVM